MTITVLDKKILSGDGVHTLAGKIYLPTGDPRGYLHVVHGMTEHIGRYDAFMHTMAEHGYICFGFDQLGHGSTAMDDSELGYIAHKNGDDLMARDVSVIAREMQKLYGRLPYYLMGHSMGSFIVRCTVMKYFTPAKLILLGTGGPNPVIGPGIAMAKIIKQLRGHRHISKTMDRLMFGQYNARFPRDNPYHWLTKDEQIKAQYAQDKYCTFKFTISAVCDLLALHRTCNSKPWFQCIQNRFPVLLVSGTDDPVGNYGAGVQTVYDRLIENGAHAEMHLYEDCRHEVLNDTCKDQVTADILSFLED